MMHRYAILLLAATGAASGPPAAPGEKPPVTVFFRFERTPSQVTFSAMKAELDRLFAPTGMRFDWQDLDLAPEIGVVHDLVVLRFRGPCDMGLLPPLPDERGPYAWTSVTDGTVQSFSAIHCDKVRNAVHYALWGGERARGDFYMGRALARVVAHELYHVFARSRKHSRGIAKETLTPAELIAEEAVLHPEDIPTGKR